MVTERRNFVNGLESQNHIPTSRRSSAGERFARSPRTHRPTSCRGEALPRGRPSGSSLPVDRGSHDHRIETMVRLVRSGVRLSLGALVLAYGAVTSLPHVHHRSGDLAITAPHASNPADHRCLQCTIPHGQALIPDHATLFCRAEPSGFLPRLDRSAVRSRPLRTSLQRAPPA